MHAMCQPTTQNSARKSLRQIGREGLVTVGADTQVRQEPTNIAQVAPGSSRRLAKALQQVDLPLLK